MQELILENESLYLSTAPEMGGVITEFTYKDSKKKRKKEIFRTMRGIDKRAKNTERAAYFPLVPYSGRIKEAQFSWNKKKYKVEKADRERHALHGEGWKTQWRVKAFSKYNVEMTSHSSARYYPFAYRASQNFILEFNTLYIGLKIKNEENFSIPVGLGLHPWFNLSNPCLKFRAKDIWHIDKEYLFESKSKIPTDLNFSRGDSLMTKKLAHGYSGWDGKACLISDELTIDMQASKELGHIQLYTMDKSGDYCIEPISNSVDAFNLYSQGMADTGVYILNPNEEFSVSTKFIIKEI